MSEAIKTKVTVNPAEEKEVMAYLLGTEWFSADQGDMPNNHEFPTKFFLNKEDAEREFVEMNKKNDTWGFGYQMAYIAPMYADGTIGERRYE